MNETQLRPEHRQQQTLSPRLQRAVRLLQLSSLDFAHEVHDLLGRNPFLESDDEDHDLALASAPATEAGEAPPPADAALPPPVDESGPERELWSADGNRARPLDGGEGLGMDGMAADVSLTEHLHSQLNVLRLPWRDLVLARAVVESLDDDGYLRCELAELGALAGVVPDPDAEELQIALRRVQALDPAGVAARSVPECLLLQLAKIECPVERELAASILRNHVPALAARDISGLARSLGARAAQVAAVCERIRGLDPRPGWRVGSGGIEYITPDVIVKKRGGAWVVNLNPSIVPRLRLNQDYAELFQRHRSAQHGEMAAHLQEARWTLHNVQQRFSTILSVAQAIINRQQHFLDYGPMAMKPLGLREIAQVVGIHESTVCRVTNNKYMATPAGTFELKYFFSRGMTSTAGGSFSPTAIKGLVRDMIAAEDPTVPLSDAEIARQLARQGLPMARRTVTKYRQGMRIEVAERRRKTA